MFVAYFAEIIIFSLTRYHAVIVFILKGIVFTDHIRDLWCGQRKLSFFQEGFGPTALSCLLLFDSVAPQPCCRCP